MSQPNDYGVFTERGYAELVGETVSRYQFEPFGTRAAEPHVLWRHDVDSSVHRALRLAQIEAENGVRATYFFLLHGWFYNLLEREVLDRAQEILSLGHWLGIHFDVGFYPGLESEEDLAGHLIAERALFEDLFGHRVAAFSFHNPEARGALEFDADEIGGMVNAYGRNLQSEYKYASDSNGYWRFQSIPELIKDGTEPRLQVLTHPEWWQKEPLPPRERVQRCIDGRARYVAGAYDAALLGGGRQNVR